MRFILGMLIGLSVVHFVPETRTNFLLFLGYFIPAAIVVEIIIMCHNDFMRSTHKEDES